MSLITHARRMLLIGALLAAAVSSLPSPVAAATQPRSEADKVLSIAAAELGHRYSFSATGPRTFDCSGLVYFVYKQAGLLDRIGGARRTVAGLHHWFAARGAASRSVATAQPGDILVWGHDHHTGIYVGNGYAISALINPWGVTRHTLGWINMKVTAVLHVSLQR